MLHRRAQRPRTAARMSILGNGLLERARSTSLALLGLTAAVGLTMVALVLNQGLPLLPGSPIPGGGQDGRSRGPAGGPAALAGGAPRGTARGSQARASSPSGGSKNARSGSHGGSARRVDVSISAPAGRRGGSEGAPAPAPPSPAPTSPAVPAPSAPAETDSSAPVPAASPDESPSPAAASSPPPAVATTVPSSSPSTAGEAPTGEQEHGHGRRRGGSKGASAETGHEGELPSAAAPPTPAEAPAESGGAEEGDIAGSGAPMESAGSASSAPGRYRGHGRH